MSRVVPDTNVAISATFWRGHPRRIFDLARRGRLILVSSAPIEAELIRVLSYPKFGLTAAEILPIVRDIRGVAQSIHVTSNVRIIADDPADNAFLECALDGEADYIVSGDHHLLSLGSFRGIAILRPRDFLVKVGFI
ncbi:MAG TPA: putative toxin-antitoxin system toxin component, PIN family [Planctomycetota bacterium]|nr:putative toxin-antitoxin system toxin component, PIN family [Planctomycetota bacterium]